MPTPDPAAEPVAAAPFFGGAGLLQAAHTFGVRSLTLACRFGLVMASTGVLSQSEYGAYALIQAVTAFGVFLCGLNLFTYVYRAVPGRPADEQMRILKTTLLFEVVVCSVLVGGLLLSGQLGRLLGLLNASGYEVAFALGLASLVLQVFAAEVTHFLLAQTRITTANWVDFLSQAAWVLPLLVLWLSGARVSLHGLLLAQIAGGVAVVILAARQVGWRAWMRARIDPATLRVALAFSIPLIVPTLGVTTMRMADRFVLSHYRSPADVAVYAFAAVFINTLYSFTAGVIVATFGPRIFTAHNQHDHARRDMLQTYMLKAALASFIVPYIVLCLTARPLIHLLDRPEYIGAVGVLPFMGISSLLLIAGFPANYMLTLQNRVGRLALIDAGGMIVALTANLLLVPRYSYYGAAMAGALGCGTSVFLQYAASGTLHALRPRIFFSLREEAALVRRLGRHLRGARA